MTREEVSFKDEKRRSVFQIKRNEQILKPTSMAKKILYETELHYKIFLEFQQLMSCLERRKRVARCKKHRNKFGDANKKGSAIFL